jgi:hypothetical protein
MQSMTVAELEALLAEGSNATLEQLVDASVRVFGLLAEAIQDPDSKQSQHLLDLVNQLKTRLEDESKKALTEAGMTEDDLKQFLDNPSNFSPEEWEQLQGIRGEMMKAGQQFTESAIGLQPPQEAPKGRPSRRQEWMEG